jgi:raffinose/stachyose/melibiose transport system permease protein
MISNTQPRAVRRTYPKWFYLPAAILFGVFFIVPTVLSFYFSLTRWTLFDATFIGLGNFRTFLSDPELMSGLRHTIVYALLACTAKVGLSLPLAMLLTSRIRLKGLLRGIVFFPTLVSIIAVGVTFAALMQPSTGLINTVLRSFGLAGPRWLGDPDLALFSVILVDIWQGLGFATVIFIAGILSIPQDYFDAVRLEGGAWAEFRHVIIPLTRNAAFTVILLAFINGLRRFDLIWAMTNGGPGFASDVMSSAIFKQYGAGFYGLSTAGNVVLFILVTLIVYPLMWFFNRWEIEL